MPALVLVVLLAMLAVRRPHRRRRRRLLKPQAIGHVMKGVAYHVGNSHWGLVLMHRAGKRWADRDLQVTSDGVIVVCHWPRPGVKDGFSRGWKLIRRSRWTPISQLTWEQVSKLRTADGYRIRRIEDDFRDMAELGINPYLEPKGDPRLSDPDAAPALWRHVEIVGRRYGLTLRGYALPQNAEALPYMRAVGIRAHQLRG